MFTFEVASVDCGATLEQLIFDKNVYNSMSNCSSMADSTTLGSGRTKAGVGTGALGGEAGAPRTRPEGREQRGGVLEIGELRRFIKKALSYTMRVPEK